MTETAPIVDSTTSLNGKGELVKLATPTRTFDGLAHSEVLELEIAKADHLVADLIEAGTLGTIAALPESYKSWLWLEIAFKVAGGEGHVLDRAKVVKGGPVGCWWQDDSLANEAARIKSYAERHGQTGDLPIRWHLNEGLRLPDDIPRLREEIEREGQVLVGLDSLYNFLPGVSLKDEEVGVILQAVKAEVCDPTGPGDGGHH